MGLMLEPAAAHCGRTALPANAAPAATAQRLAGSQVARAQRDIAWVCLGSPTERYPHAALGSRTHAGSLHVLTATGPGAATGTLQEIIYRLPIHRAFEDLTLRLANIDQDGRDELVVVESDALRGSSVVVFGLEDSPNGKALREKARSAPAGSTFRWLNPVGVADFDGDFQTLRINANALALNAKAQRLCQSACASGQQRISTLHARFLHAATTSSSPYRVTPLKAAWLLALPNFVGHQRSKPTQK